PVRVARDGAARRQRNAELIDHAAFRAGEAHREQHELALERELAAWHRLEDGPAVLLYRDDVDGPEPRDAAMPVVDELGRRDRIQTLAALLVRRGDAEDVGPLRPGIVGRPRLGRTGQQLELVHRECALTMGGAEAVGARVAAA